MSFDGELPVAPPRACYTFVQGELGIDIGSHLGMINLKTPSYSITSNAPATQFPTPALKDWSSSKAFIGHAFFLTPFEKSSSEGIDSMGSKPSAEIGGSFLGSVQSRIRPRRRASTKAISVSVPSASPSPDKWRMN